MPETRKFIHGRELITQLWQAGLIGPVDTISQVIITAKVDDIVTMEVTHIGDKRIYGIAEEILRRQLEEEAKEDESYDSVGTEELSDD